MMDDFLRFLREPIAQRSLLACVMIGFANGFVSGLVILKKSALQIGTLSCALLPGIAHRHRAWRPCRAHALHTGACRPQQALPYSPGTCCARSPGCDSCSIRPLLRCCLYS